MAAVSQLVEQRQRSLDYLKRVHEGPHPWMNVAFLKREHINNRPSEEQAARTQSLFYLGLSLGPVLALDSGAATVRAVAQLLEELDYHMAGAATQTMVRGGEPRCRTPGLPHTCHFLLCLFRSHACTHRSRSLCAPQKFMMARSLASQAAGDRDDLKPSLLKSGKRHVYEILRTPPIPGDLDHCLVFVSLCEVLAQVYGKFNSEQGNSSAILAETVLKIDTRVKALVIAPTTAELNRVAEDRMAAELAGLTSATASDLVADESGIVGSLLADGADGATDLLASAGGLFSGNSQ
jgi:hypothetical protein